MKPAYESGASALYKEEDINNMITKLDAHHGHSLFGDIVELGVNVGLRISDLLSIKMDDERLDVTKGLFYLVEQKTGKQQVTTFPPELMVSMIIKRKSLHPDHTFLFQSPSNRARAISSPVSIRSVNRAMEQAAKSLKLDGKYSSHALRKGFATALLEKGVPIETISKLLNHSSITTTQKYLDVGYNKMLEVRRMASFVRAVG
jgi:site-specific recombinase XerD